VHESVVTEEAGADGLPPRVSAGFEVAREPDTSALGGYRDAAAPDRWLSLRFRSEQFPVPRVWAALAILEGGLLTLFAVLEVERKGWEGVPWAAGAVLFSLLISWAALVANFDRVTILVRETQLSVTHAIPMGANRRLAAADIAELRVVETATRAQDCPRRGRRHASWRARRARDGTLGAREGAVRSPRALPRTRFVVREEQHARADRERGRHGRRGDWRGGRNPGRPHIESRGS
jgi:hypothetical protein